MGVELARAGCLTGARAVWSMWPGYLKRDRGARDWFVDHGIPLTVVHASGHASVLDLQRLAAAMDPVRVVPIHTGAPALYPAHFERVEFHGDGEWWAV
jgi:ribonuclease J